MSDCFNETRWLGVEPMNCLAVGHSLHLPQTLPSCVGAFQEASCIMAVSNILRSSKFYGAYHVLYVYIIFCPINCEILGNYSSHPSMVEGSITSPSPSS